MLANSVLKRDKQKYFQKQKTKMSDTLNLGQARDRRQRFGAHRGRDLYWGFTIGFFADAATMFIIYLGRYIPNLSTTSVVVGAFIFIYVNFFDCMHDFKANP